MADENSKVFNGNLSQNDQILLNPQNPTDDQTPTELRKRFEHLRRITRKQSQPQMRAHPGSEKFEYAYDEFEDFYTRDQLRSLEKCFLLADHDKDDLLSPTELKYWLEKHGVPINHFNLRHVLNLVDLDEGRPLDFSGFLRLCKTIELKEAEGSKGNVKIFFDCIGEDTMTDLEDREKVKKNESFAQLKADVLKNVKYFENRIAEELSTPKPQPNEVYYERVQEITQTAFSLQDFFKNIRHPNQEVKEICDETVENVRNVPNRHVTEACITLENNQKRLVSNNTETVDKKIDAQVTVPAEKFDENNVENNEDGI